MRRRGRSRRSTRRRCPHHKTPHSCRPFGAVVGVVVAVGVVGVVGAAALVRRFKLRGRHSKPVAADDQRIGVAVLVGNRDVVEGLTVKGFLAVERHGAVALAVYGKRGALHLRAQSGGAGGLRALSGLREVFELPLFCEDRQLITVPEDSCLELPDSVSARLLSRTLICTSPLGGAAVGFYAARKGEHRYRQSTDKKYGDEVFSLKQHPFLKVRRKSLAHNSAFFKCVQHNHAKFYELTKRRIAAKSVIRIPPARPFDHPVVLTILRI